MKSNDDDLGLILQTDNPNVNQPDNKGVLPLHYAILRRDDLLLEWLISNGADVNYPVNILAVEWFTPIHIAVVVCNIAALELLLAHGADLNQIAYGAGLNQAYNDGVAPLQLAVERDTKVLEWLLDHGANV